MSRLKAKAEAFFFIKREKDGMYYAGLFTGDMIIPGPIYSTDITLAWRFDNREEAKAKVEELQTRKWYRFFTKDKYTVMSGQRFKS